MKVKKFETVVVKRIGFCVNTYVIENHGECLVVDPGGDMTSVKEYLANKKLVAVLLTHGHYDHIGSLTDFNNVPIYVSKYDKEMIFDDDYNCAKMFGLHANVKGLDFRYLEGDQDLDLIGLKIKVIETPGHTKGSLCYLIENNLISGDTLFYNSVGRTDLYSGSASDMKKSVTKLLSMLSNNVNVYPGHDECGKLSEMKKVNPYLK